MNLATRAHTANTHTLLSILSLNVYIYNIYLFFSSAALICLFVQTRSSIPAWESLFFEKPFFGIICIFFNNFTRPSQILFELKWISIIYIFHSRIFIVFTSNEVKHIDPIILIKKNDFELLSQFERRTLSFNRNGGHLRESEWCWYRRHWNNLLSQVSHWWQQIEQKQSNVSETNRNASNKIRPEMFEKRFLSPKCSFNLKS